MIRLRVGLCHVRAGWPRTSGDDPVDGFGLVYRDTLAPPRAGMIRCGASNGSGKRRWPRTSGDDPVIGQLKASVKELAPHERG